MARPPDDDAGIKRRRHAAAQARFRSRVARNVELYEFEVGEFEYTLAIKYAGLREDQTTNKAAANRALGILLRKGLLALVTQEEARRKK